MDLVFPDPLLAPRNCSGLAVGALQQFKTPCHGVTRVGSFDGTGIGRVHPEQRSIGVAGPHRAGRGIEQGTQCVELGQRPCVALAQPHQFKPVAGDVADAQHSTPAHGAAFRFQMAPAQAVESDAETLATAAQAIDAGLELLGRGGRQPGTEREHAARHGSLRDQRQVALDIGLFARRSPGDDNLRFRRKKDVGPIEGSPQAGEIVAEGRLALGPLLAAGQVEQRRDCRDQHQRDNEGDAGEAL